MARSPLPAQPLRRPPAPLTGVRVLDLTTVLAGPYSTYQLALLGAEVIKLEKPGGEWARQGTPTRAATDLSAQFVAQNAGKKSIEINLKTGCGRAQALALMATCDVVVESFSPGVADRLGVGYIHAQSVRPDIVYCSLSGYGQDGALSHRPAYDHVIQAASGVTMLNGAPDTAPNRIGPPMVDYIAGQYAAFAVLAALRERDQTAQPQFVDVAMLDVALVCMASTVSLALNTEETPTANGNTAASDRPLSGIFPTADGLLAITANHHSQFVRAMRVMGLAALELDPRFASDDNRALHADALRAIVRERLQDRPALEWERLLSSQHVPAAKVRTLPEVLAEDHVATRGTVQTVTDPYSGGALAVPSIGFKWNGAALGPAFGPPRLGEHTEAVLRALNIAPCRPCGPQIE